MTQEQKECIVMVRSHLEFIRESIAKPDEKPDKMVTPFESVITLLRTIPEVDRTSAIAIISEIGTDKSPYYKITKLLSKQQSSSCPLV